MLLDRLYQEYLIEDTGWEELASMRGGGEQRGKTTLLVGDVSAYREMYVGSPERGGRIPKRRE